MKHLLDYTDILAEVPCYFGYLCMADRFCKKYMEVSKKNELVFIILSFSCWMFLSIINRQYYIPQIFLMIFENIFFMVLVLLLYKADREKKILAASILMLVMTLVRNFFGAFLSCLFLFFQHTVNNIPEPFFNELEFGLIDCMSFGMVILVVYWMSKHLKAVFYGKPGKWYVILAIPLLVIIVVFDIASWGASNGIMFRSEGNMGIYYDQIFSNIEICVLTCLSMFAAGFYVFGMDKIYLEQEKSNQYNSQIAVYEMLEEQYRQSESLRHDMKNHIIALSGLFQSREWEKMGDYLKNMESSSLEIGGDITGNKAVDALLYQKRKWAERQNIQWKCDVQMSKVYCINEFDFCILFGNILDNALEACERLKCSESCFVNIQARTVKKFFILEVKNSMDLIERYENGHTKKENPQEHGIGLLNVKDVVNRYNGTVNIEAENGIFVISILIPMHNK